MLTVGDKLPEFSLQAVVSNDLDNAFINITDKSFSGKWKVLFFYPKDFTFVCPTEIAEFGKMNVEFEKRDAQIIGASIDSEFVHLAWRNDHKDLNNLPYPLLSDIKRELSANLGILDPEAGVTLRATFIIDPDNVIQHASVNGLNVGRNPKEILRILDAAQTDELCPCNWNKGDEVLRPAS